MGCVVTKKKNKSSFLRKGKLLTRIATASFFKKKGIVRALNEMYNKVSRDVNI